MSIITYNFKKDRNIKLNDYFKVEEFISNATLKNLYLSGKYSTLQLDSALVDYLYLLRKNIGAPIYITSGFRPVQYNKSIGGSTNSYHCKGMAADIVVKGLHPIKIAYIAADLGIKGIGIYSYNSNKYNNSVDGFVHIDTRSTNYNWLQLTKNSKYEGINKIMPTLKQGDRGGAVKLLQRQLGLVSDGIFGPITRRTLINKYGESNITDNLWNMIFN